MTHDSSAPASSPRERRAPSDDGVLRVGLIGRAGSGKTTVANAWRERGAEVLEADRIGHQVTDGDPEVRAALIAEYDAEVYLADGRLDRARVAARVFRDSEALARLDHLVHPRILAKLRDSLAARARSGERGVVVIDAALLLRWRFERECDVVVAVVAPQARQIERLIAGRGWTEAQARERLAAQLPDEALAAAADEVIENDGTLEQLVAHARRVLDSLVARPRGSAPA
ncbi:MAG: dephospho-CoA kinase [Candidatus Eisenbacteria bacterium]|uniref:Dephospho-CoA kinase n=1 Tax=Eiseniibacteriota bacterium TaxID=2212470 RepID=A0A849SMB2_UNCEI|nr:dephospho-CoA kinase [Candidatus Eisenbacteria bacterium]